MAARGVHIEISDAEIQGWAIREFGRRAQTALAIYRSQPLKRDAPGYPFKQRPEDGSIRNKRSSSVRPIPGGVRIAVESRGAPFIEAGNDRGGSYIHGKMAIPLKSGARPRGKITIVDGKPMLVVQRVRTYKGRHLLERSVRAAFGLSNRAS